MEQNVVERNYVQWIVIATSVMEYVRMESASVNLHSQEQLARHRFYRAQTVVQVMVLAIQSLVSVPVKSLGVVLTVEYLTYHVIVPSRRVVEFVTQLLEKCTAPTVILLVHAVNVFHAFAIVLGHHMGSAMR